MIPRIAPLALAACHAPDEGAPEPHGGFAGPGVAGLVIGADEEALAEVAVLACSTAWCLTGASDDRGRFVFEIEPPAAIALKTHPGPSEVPRVGAALQPVRIEDADVVTAAPLYVPDLPQGVLLGPDREDPQTFACGDGLELTLRTADLVPAVGELLFDLACREIPPEHQPVYAELGDEQVVAVYALHPFGATSASPIAVSAPTDLPAGARVWFRSVSELDGTLSEPAPGTSDGARATTDADAGIDRLTHLVISAQP